MRRAREGHAESFGKLYDQFQPELLRYLAHRLRNRELAEDLTQQVFVKAWQAMPRYEQRSVPFKAWLYRIAHNQLVDYFRTHRQTVDLHAIEAAAEADVEGQAIAGDQRRRLQAALLRLSEDHRQVLVLRFLMEQSAAEVGEIMGRKEVTVRGLQLRALRALRTEFEAIGGVP